MKFIYLFLTIIMSNYAFTQENNSSLPLEKNHHDIFLSKDKKIDEESNFSLICYSQAIAVWNNGFCRSQLVPLGLGYGASLRFHETSQAFGLQLDGNEYTILLFSATHYIQGSTSVIYYPFYYMGNDSIMSRFNLTFGTAVNYEFERNYPITKFKGETRFMLPLSIGYQGKNLFFDIGIPNVIPNAYNENYPLAIQTAKVGIRF